MIKKVSILFIAISLFFWGLAIKHYEIYPINEIRFIKHKILFKLSNNNISTDKCFEKLRSNDDEKKIYKNVLVIGHAYGDPYGLNNGIYPKLINHFNDQQQKWDYIISAGDSVRVASRSNFVLVSKQLKKFSNNVIFVPGNHDIGKIDNDFKLGTNIFLKEFKTLFNYIKIDDTLIFTINTNNKKWNVDETQKLKIKKIIEKNYNSKNIIIISHQVTWINKFNNSVLPNNVYPKDMRNNFNEFENSLKIYNKNLYFISGDVGALIHRSHTFCKSYGNTTYIATGMGSRLYDNYLTIKIYDKILNINKKTF